MLGVEGLHSGYGAVPILHGVSFEVGAQEFVGVLGHNGMGKTTLLKTLVGLLKANAGRIRLDGDDVTNLKPESRVHRGLGYVPQGREIFPALSVRENLLMGALSVPGGRAERVDEVLSSVPRLRNLLDRRGGALSGGEQQLLAIARCLCGQPRLILLDEPTEGIQPSIIEEIAELLKRLREEGRISLILVEQNLDFIRALSDRVLIIHRGQITQEVTPERLADPEMANEFLGVSTADS